MSDYDRDVALPIAWFSLGVIVAMVIVWVRGP